MITSSFNPRSGQVVATLPDADTDLVHIRVRLAQAAAPVLAASAPAVRREWLEAIARALEENQDELVALADAETALGVPRLTAELARTAGQLRFYGDVAVEGSYLGLTLDTATATTPSLVRLNRPIGPVAVFGASNFPFAFSVLGNDTGAALAAGCPVVVKAHPAHVGLSHRLADLAIEALAAAGAPEGTLTLVSGQQAGIDLVLADGIEAVAFTGSEAGGMAIWAAANSRTRVIPVYAEMGTVNPVVVTSAGMADFAAVAKGFVESFTLGNGQYCTKPGLLFAPAGREAAATIAEALLAAVPEPTMLTSGIAVGVGEGLARLQNAGAVVAGLVPGSGTGWYAPAAVLAAPISALSPGSDLLAECFGPVTLVVEYADTAELHHALTLLPGHLAATVVSGGVDDAEAGWLVETLALNAGRVTVGDWPTGVAYTWAQNHGGPWPATSYAKATSVGAAGLDRFVRPVTYQSVADSWLPEPARTGNPWRIPRRVDGRLIIPRAPRKTATPAASRTRKPRGS
ncbi:MAG: aldehyde dehydrogenase family protein [Nocardioides sp.]